MEKKRKQNVTLPNKQGVLHKFHQIMGLPSFHWRFTFGYDAIKFIKIISAIRGQRLQLGMSANMFSPVQFIKKNHFQ
jgi:hypothetical protein